MTLTLDIPEELLERAETYALAYGKNLDELLLGMLEASLAELPPPPSMTREARQEYAQARMQALAAERGVNWDTMNQEERDQFLLDIIEN